MTLNCNPTGTLQIEGRWTIDDGRWATDDRGCLSNRSSFAISGTNVHRPSSIVHRPLFNFTRRLQAISHPSHAANQTAAVVAQLLSQVAYMHVNDVSIAQIIVAPDPVEDNVAREHLSRMRQEKLKHLELTRRKLDKPPVPGHAPGLAVENKVTQAQRLLKIDAAPPQNGPRSRHQLLEGKRLDEVIVGPTVQPLHTVFEFAARREHQNANIALRPQPPAYLYAVHTGQHHIKHYQVGLD